MKPEKCHRRLESAAPIRPIELQWYEARRPCDKWLKVLTGIFWGSNPFERPSTYGAALWNRSLTLRTPTVRRHGLAHVDRERLARNIADVAAVLKVPAPATGAVYTDALLPPLALRQLPR